MTQEQGGTVGRTVTRQNKLNCNRNRNHQASMQRLIRRNGAERPKAIPRHARHPYLLVARRYRCRLVA